MPTRCKKGFNRYPPKTGDCILKSEIQKKKLSMKNKRSIKNKRSTENKTSNSRKPRCKNGTRRHPPKTGLCVEKHLIGKKERIPTLVLPSSSEKKSKLTKPSSSKSPSNNSIENRCDSVISKWLEDHWIDPADLEYNQREELNKHIEEIKQICKNDKTLSDDDIYGIISKKIGWMY